MSGTYLDQHGWPDNSVSAADVTRETNNTYQSLLPSSSRSELRPPSTVTGISEAYLHARDSCSSPPQVTERSSRNYPSRHRHCYRHKHDKRFSRSSSVAHSEDLKNLYLKIKIGFSLLCMMNILIIVFCILTNPKFKVFPDEDDDDFLYTGDGQPKTLKLCTKCQPLEAKVSSADGLIERIRSTKFPDFCCFRRVDQLLELVDWYAKVYVKQEADKIKARFPVKANTTYLAPDPVFAHLYMKGVDSPSSGIHKEDRDLTWETTGVGVQLEHMKLIDSQKLVIQQTGYYYIYSHLKFKGNETFSEYRHTISINNPVKFLLKTSGITDRNDTNSVLQGIYKLDTGNTLSVTATYKRLVKPGRVNYFGIYKL